MAAKDDKKYRAPADALSSDAYPAVTTDPDAKNYLIRPTSEEINPALGEVPADRFQEEVHKEAEGASGDEAHPEENRPAASLDPASLE